jgi:Flp pilus assembly protein TadB
VLFGQEAKKYCNRTAICRVALDGGKKGASMGPHIVVVLMSIVVLVCVFSFLAVSSWSKARLRERQAFYKSETIRKIAESQGGGAALEYLRESDHNAARQRREGQKLAGLITFAVGVGVMIFLRKVPISPESSSDSSAYLVGLIPVLVGVALLVYSYLLAPKD